MNKHHLPFIKTLSKNSVFYFIGIFIANISIIVTNIVMARYLSKEDYGILATVQYIAGIFFLIMNFGIPEATTKLIATEFKGPQKQFIGKSIKTASILMLLICTLFGALQFLFAEVIASYYPNNNIIFYIRITALWGIPFAVSLLGFSIIEGMQKIRISYLLKNIYEPLKLVVAFSLIATSAFSVKSIIISWTSLYVIYAVVIFFFLKFFFSKEKINLALPVQQHEMMHLFKQSFPFYMPFIAPVLITMLLPLIIGNLHTSSDVAAFAVVLPFTSLTPLLFMPLARALLPAISSDFVQQRHTITHILRLLFKVIGLTNIVIFFILTTMGHVLIQLFFGEKYISSQTILLILIMAAYFENFKYATDPLLKGTTHVKVVALLDYFRIATLFILGYPTISIYGAQGAALTLCFINIPTIIIKLWFIKKKMHINLWSIFIRETILIVAIALGTFYAIPTVLIFTFMTMYIFVFKLITLHELKQWRSALSAIHKPRI